MTERKDTAKAEESETVDKRNADGTPDLSQEQEAQQAMGETTEPDFESTSGLSPEAIQANATRPEAEEENNK